MFTGYRKKSKQVSPLSKEDTRMAKKTVAKKKAVKKITKATAKKATPKKTAVKKAAANKIVKKVAKVTPKKATVKKSAPKKTAVKKVTKVTQKKATVKKSAPKKTAVKKIAQKVTKAAVATPKKAISKKTTIPKAKPLLKKELTDYKKQLFIIKEKLLRNINDLEDENLKRSQRDISGDLSGYSIHLADMGTDNYDRELALNLASTESELLHKVDTALERIESNDFGICDCGKRIQTKRLQAVPYARLCIACKEEEEKLKKEIF